MNAAPNVLHIDGHPAVISFDSYWGQLRGEILGLSSTLEFYANSIEELREEGWRTLKAHLTECRNRGTDAYTQIPGTLVLGLPLHLQGQITAAAEAADMSVSVWVQEALERAVRRTHAIHGVSGGLYAHSRLGPHPRRMTMKPAKGMFGICAGLGCGLASIPLITPRSPFNGATFRAGP